jgi:hypothetical protein
LDYGKKKSRYGGGSFPARQIIKEKKIKENMNLIYLKHIHNKRK